MELSKQTTDQIRKEAEVYCPMPAMIEADGLNKMACEMQRAAYEEGATAWAIWKEKAEGLENKLVICQVALMQIRDKKDYPAGYVYHAQAEEIATKALEQYK